MSETYLTYSILGVQFLGSVFNYLKLTGLRGVLRTYGCCLLLWKGISIKKKGIYWFDYYVYFFSLKYVILLAKYPAHYGFLSHLSYVSQLFWNNLFLFVLFLH